ncbi:hypothetical protein HNQ94_000085 [Salirhabdus euzebyi]|uniref:Uncharacterized protein n=1 Tax=Salirhabdus euzebyi TaxID=394506 RepID=A0A841PVB5_9BACI|nr:hypothetical protein [Salirhabdus euzebyi]MBB6451664.1 hypothetical protein [Salirhabdus euzebyi]
MSKDKLTGLYILWILVLIIELGWLLAVATSTYDTGILAFIITLIAVTIAIGAAGLILLSKYID